MLNIPEDIRTRFDALLTKRAVPSRDHNHYKKWLRYYLDFCKKYHFHESKRESIPHYIREIQNLLAHKRVETTMIYTHHVATKNILAVRSPLDE